MMQAAGNSQIYAEPLVNISSSLWSSFVFMELRLFGSLQSSHSRLSILICNAYETISMKYECTLPFVEVQGFVYICCSSFNN